MVKKSLKILIANGVNLDLLGSRETEVYGDEDLVKLEASIEKFKLDLEKLYSCSILLEFYQTNSEAEFLTKISDTYDGIVINPAAWTHTSVALADRLSAVKTPYIETHISNISSREEFRKKSYTAPGASGVVYGMGFSSYKSALLGLVDLLD